MPRIYDNHYGTSQQWVLHQLEKNIDVILEIDWQGAQVVRQQFPECISIFILPPSKETLRQRLISRKQDNDFIINKRFAKAKEEVMHYHEFDYLIVNDNFNHAIDDLKHIIRGQRLFCDIQAEVLADLLAEWTEKQ